MSAAEETSLSAPEFSIIGMDIVVDEYAISLDRARAIHNAKLRGDIQGIIGRHKLEAGRDPSDGMHFASACGERTKATTELGALRKLWNLLRAKNAPARYHSVTNHTHSVMHRQTYCAACGR